MPNKPPVWCGKCRTVHPNGVCPHRKPFERKRNQPKQSGRGGRRWGKLREFIFIRDKFLCQICKRKGVLTPVELHGDNHGICDHIKPKAEGGTDNPDNLETICQCCDKEKTAEESHRANTGGV